jgi:succinate dehydrogenase / fumarate reductase flavoprotein subunit
VREAGRLQQCIANIESLKGRFARLNLSDSAAWTNQSLSYTRAVGDMLSLAEAVAKGSLARRESRGAHYRSDFQQRNDAEFMKTTLTKYDAASNSVSVEFVSIDADLIAPAVRNYGKKDDSSPKAAAKPALSGV